MAVDIKTLKIRLIEAEDAYHQLLTGTKEVSVNVGNFGSVTYNQTSRTALEAYISSLKSQIANVLFIILDDSNKLMKLIRVRGNTIYKVSNDIRQLFDLE